ncbi:DUF411 domain-containing protein [Rhizobium sp. GN54]|uniref:DUF411 domain-containing protein n=1 Tax=Rhizobium sp. GN54 TaxID=2898150 RepID=UPI001E36FAEE|nr:DUF411 domain-containing protein [Rhizobium sp. GN54]MCD2185467.1 DUF411 domain-containing protein [Rhizobium sp. GN54]
MKRRDFLLCGAALSSGLMVRPAFATGESMVVYKDPNCGCCHEWTSAMKNAGFSVVSHDLDDLEPIKKRFAIPADMQGCHTASLAGYFIEGHVPLDAITRLLAERPNIAGLAVPGMPSGSLGMGDDPGASYDVFAVAKDGAIGVYQSVRPRP